MHAVDMHDRLMAIAADGALLCTAMPGRAGQRNGADIAPLMSCLRERLPHAADGLWIAVPPWADGPVLGEALRQLRAAGYGVQGFADRAVVLAAWLQRPGHVAVLDVARHVTAVSLVVNDGASVALRRTVRLPGGESALHDAWLNLAAATLVQQTRFDPLHDQRYEAQLRQLLPGLAAAAQRSGQGSCTIDTGSAELSLTLARDQLADAASAWLAPLTAALQALSAATEDCALLVPESALDIPGLAEVLVAARFSATLSFVDGAPASAASLLPAAAATTTGAVQYLTRVPLLTTHVEPPRLTALDLGDGPAQVMATHIVFRGRAHPIAATGMVIGRDPGEGSVLRLPEGVAGLSRRHCTLRRDGARTQIVDHSTYGSFIDGMRVRGRMLLPAGSVLRLGEPGIELPLVALD